jgi:hypothetical protein
LQIPSLLKSGIFGCLLATVATSSAAINFQFSYTGSDGFLDGSEGATRQAALQDAANTLSSYFVTSSNVTINFEVNSYTTNNTTLASAGSPTYYYVGVPDFYRTVIQEKVITGGDDNGGDADGNINWNWHHSWGVGPTVPLGQFDMASVAMHEILHAMGFATRVGAPGTNGTNIVWSVFDRYLVDSTGAALISATGVWQGLDSALTNGGLFFNGPNAMAANGGNPVALYAPASWSDGSSASHVDSSEGIMIMNPSVTSGDGTEGLGPIELGMLKDIGYGVVGTIPEPSSTLLLLSGATFAISFRRRGGMKAA